MTPETPPSAGRRNEPLVGFALGLLLLFVAQLIVGLVTELSYSATPDGAYRTSAALPGFLRGFHYWGSAVLIALSFAAVAWMLFQGWWRGERVRAWTGMVLLMLCSAGFQITGNLLPFDRHGVQTAVVESGIARQMPIAGGFAAKTMLGGDTFGPGTLRLWHMAHLALPLLGLLAAVLLLGGLRREKRLETPVWVPLAICLALGLLLKAPLGAPGAVADYSAFDAQVSWYTWPMHGALNLFQRISPSLGWIGSGLLPGLFVAFLLALPLLGRKLRPRGAQIVFGAFLVIFGVAAVFFGGSFAALTGDRDPIAANIDPTRATAVDPKLYAQGQVLFNSKTCSDCHGKDGKESLGGPALTGEAQKRGFDPAWYMKFIHKPTSVRPNSTMPEFPDLTQNELRAVAEFIIHQK